MSYLNDVLDDAAARLAVPGDSVLIASKDGMTIHFRLSDDELRPATRTLADAQRCGFSSVEEFEFAIRMYEACF